MEDGQHSASKTAKLSNCYDSYNLASDNKTTDSIANQPVSNIKTESFVSDFNIYYHQRQQQIACYQQRTEDIRILNEPVKTEYSTYNNQNDLSQYFHSCLHGQYSVDCKQKTNCKDSEEERANPPKTNSRRWRAMQTEEEKELYRIKNRQAARMRRASERLIIQQACIQRSGTPSDNNTEDSDTQLDFPNALNQALESILERRHRCKMLQRALRAARTPEQVEAEREKNRIAQRLRRAQMSDEERRSMRERVANTKRFLRASRSEEQKQVDNAKVAARKRQQRADMSAEEKEFMRAKQKYAVKAKRARNDSEDPNAESYVCSSEFNVGLLFCFSSLL